MSISGDHDERRHPPRRHHRAGARSSGLRPVLRGHPPAEADDIPSLRVLQGRLSRLRRPGEKKAGRSFAGPAHEPGGGGGDPQAHLQSLSRLAAASPFRTCCPRWMFPPPTRCRLFYVWKIGFSTVYAQVRSPLRRRAALHCRGVGNLTDSVERAVASGLPPGTLVLVACSGGADSVALGASAVKVDLRCAIGHVDHGLRAGSAADADRVRELARRLGVEFHLKRIEQLNVSGPGLEAAARIARYEALAELASAAGATFVATAHTRRDQAETLLLRLFRGAGPGALAGVRRRRVLAAGIELVRPLLDVSRAATEAYCRANGFGWVDDPHNVDPARARARLRALWPALLEFNPRLEEALSGAAALFAEENELLDALAGRAGRLHPVLQRRALLAAANE